MKIRKLPHVYQCQTDVAQAMGWCGATGRLLVPAAWDCSLLKDSSVYRTMFNHAKARTGGWSVMVFNLYLNPHVDAVRGVWFLVVACCREEGKCYED